MVKIKKIVSIVTLALSITVSNVPFQNVVGTNEVVQAASVKLSKSSLTLDVGKSATLKVTGTKSKVKWSSSNKGVATVTSKGKVTAKQSGTSTIYAKVGKKTIKCKVTVKEQFSASEATKNIGVTLQDTGKGVVAILKNNNKMMVDIDAKLVYFSQGGMVDTSSDFTRALESGMECALFFANPMNGDYDYVDYDDFKITLSVDKANYEKSCMSGIEIESDRGADNVTAQVSNNSGMDFEFIKIAVVYYDASGKAIGYEYSYANCLKDGSVDYLSFDYPYNSKYETIHPNNYKIYVNEAYASAW